ncbi:MAG: shikimate kinase, partial [Alistipes sp.]|nr:shikimate kinase [Alistipes sp.]
KIAKAANMQFVDMDSMIEQKEGASVSDIFAYAGEEYFRRTERNLIEELAQSEDDMVISTGGGVPTWQDNMERMNSIGESFYLRRSAQQIASRLSPHGRQKRPKLRGLSDEELVEFMTRNMAEREPFYQKATHVVECADKSDDSLIEYILGVIKR